jgi:dTMP kinase
VSRGLFITFEGTEGGGKSTQIKLLAERLRAHGRETVELREPGGTPLGEEIRHLLKHSDAGRNMTPETELLLMCASRAQLVRDVIHPALAAGRIVLCDRFYDSTLAYQGHGRGLDLERVRRVIEFAVGDLKPDLTLLLHVPVGVSEERRLARNQPANEARDRFEEADRAFFERVEAGFNQLAAAEPDRIKTIEATRTIEAVGEAIWKVVRERFPLPV